MCIRMSKSTVDMSFPTFDSAKLQHFFFAELDYFLYGNTNPTNPMNWMKVIQLE